MLGRQVMMMGGVTIPLLDQTGAAWAAYSFRKLRTAYAGNCIRVKRTSDGTTQDIGFASSGWVNTSAIASFCAGTTGRITIWYDQSGNGRNTGEPGATGTRPIIYESGAVKTDANGRVYAYHPDAERTCCNVINASFSTSSDLSAFFCVNPSFPGAGDWRFGGAYTAGIMGVISGSPNTLFWYNAGYKSHSSGVSAGNRYVWSMFRSGSSLLIAQNGGSAETVGTGFGGFSKDTQGVGASAKGTYPTLDVDNGQEFNGKFYEMIIFSSYNTTDKSKIESSMLSTY